MNFDWLNNIFGNKNQGTMGPPPPPNMTQPQNTTGGFFSTFDWSVLGDIVGQLPDIIKKPGTTPEPPPPPPSAPMNKNLINIGITVIVVLIIVVVLKKMK